MNKYADLQVDDVIFHKEGQGMKIQWSSDTLGFGEVTITMDDNRNIVMDTEAMSKEFVIALLTKMVQQGKI